MKRVLLAITLTFLSAIILTQTVTAQQTCLTINAKTTDAYINEIPSINKQFATCTVAVQSNVHSLVGDGNILISIGTKQFYFTLKNQQVAGVTAGTPTTYGYEVKMNEKTFDSLLTSNNVFDDILQGINNGAITITAKTFWGKIKWFFAKWFLPKPGNNNKGNTGNQGGNAGNQGGPKGKPDNCDDTYLPGHREYANNKEKWDGYSANTDAVCQSQYGKGTPSPCIHTVQLSINGNPYYLCWYNK